MEILLLATVTLNHRGPADTLRPLVIGLVTRLLFLYAGFYKPPVKIKRNGPRVKLGRASDI